MATYFNAALGNTLTLVKTGETWLDFLSVQNGGASAFWVQCFDAAATSGVTLGTTAPNASFFVPATSARSIDGLIRFSKGLVIAITATANGAGAPAANATIEALEYR